MEEIGLPQYKEVFVENDINGPALLDLNKQELQEELGITSFGHRKLILKKIGELKEKELRQSTQEEAILYKKIGSGASAEVYHGLWKGQECAGTFSEFISGLFDFDGHLIPRIAAYFFLILIFFQ